MPTPAAKPTAPAATRRARLAVASGFTVDRSTGIITSLQLLESGREAKGWGFWVDEITLTTGLDVIKAKGGRLKSYFTHDHESPASWYRGDEDGTELDVCGWFSDIAIANGQLVAGRHQFYDSFKVDDKPRYDRLLDIAANTPELAGLSIEMWFHCVFVGEDGVEYQARPEGIALRYGGMPVARIEDIFGAAFVAEGAATSGLFAKLSRRPKGRGLLARLAAVLGIEDEPPGSPANAEGKTPEEIAAAEASAKNAQPPGPHVEPVSTNTSATMKLIKDLQTRFAADKASLAAAMAILGDAPNPETLTLDGVLAQLGVNETTRLRTEVGTLTTAKTKLETDNATLTAKVKTLEGEIATLKASGHAGGVQLGTGGGAPVGGDVNPYSPATLNFSAQARLEKSDPAKAAALKAAAATPPAAAAPAK